MKARRLTKKSLDELAQVMPVLSEKEQSEMVGGDYYYTSGGEFLGQLGNGSTIRIVDESNYNTKARSINDPECLEIDKRGYIHQLNLDSTNLSGISAEARKNIVQHIVNNVGGSGNITVINDLDPNSKPGKFIKGSDPTNDVITINASAAIYLSANNQTDIELTILHEQTHFQNRNMPSSTEKEVALIELKSYQAVINSDKFKNASGQYQAKARQLYNKYLNIYNGK